METMKAIVEEMIQVIRKVNQEEYSKLANVFSLNNRFFFVGEGRSGLVAKMIAMRLMHSGKEVYVVGETITPAIKKKDVLVAISGSGKTKLPIYVMELAKEAGAYTYLITANKEALRHNKGLYLPASTKQNRQVLKTVQPLSNLFDQVAHIVLDGIIIDSISPSIESDVFMSRHSNLE